MTQEILIIRKTREWLLASLENFTIEQLNTIPPGYNNNIMWNLGHMAATQLGVCYLRGGVDLPAGTNEFFETYRSGTKPERLYTTEDLEQIKTYFFSYFDQLQADVQTSRFDNYTPWTTRYDIAVKNINDAVGFLPFHDGLHIGVIFGLRKLV
ncbi:DinB family protein [Mucilaginibacter myungsuensis]|uniref:DinB family protein n=1 Tax=Mucilaginibacter myungsuensis TaxID=649104 RepID=A0A929KVT1_9SPHI|nr:DinB family protein [Mucilaginibacter myungsuensis]MBE9661637.1 DinB family protein [Mucilaginibacter myungsuensis]